MKITYIIESLLPTGGTERIITEKANYYADQLGYEISVIKCIQTPDQPNAFKLSDKIQQINLGIPYYSQYRYHYPKRFWIRRSIRKRIKKSVTQAIQQIDPDIVIGTGRFNADLICKINCRAKKIIECHEARALIEFELKPKKFFLSKFFVELNKRKYFSTIERNADIVVTLTEKDKEQWKKAKQVEVIPNFSDMIVTGISTCENKRVIAVGRLEWEKGYERLLEAWKPISLKHPDWRLDIYGDGSLENQLKEMIKTLGIENTSICHATPHISQEYANSSICVMSSFFEGFALVLLEALRHGVPCVAFDCPCGPGSIIKDKQCGFLVENHNNVLFVEKINKLIENEELRKSFSKAALKRAEAFNMNVIIQKWKNLFDQVLNS